MRKRTLFILRVPPPYGGGEIVSNELYKHLKDKYDFVLIKQKNHSKSKQANPGIYSIISGLGFIFSSIKSIIIKRPEILYIGLSKGFYAFIRNSIVILFAYLFKIKIIGELHGMTFPFLVSKWKRKYFNFIIKKIKKIRVLSHSIKYYIEDLGYLGKVYVINNGISKFNFEKNIHKENKDKIKFLYLGAISKAKGFYDVIDIFKDLNKNKYNNWELNVIGEWIHPIENNHYNNIIDKDIKDKIVFHGKLIDREKWVKIYKNDFLIHLTKFDGQPLTIIETMSLGIPAITTKVGAIPEMINNNKNGFLVNDKKDTMNIIKKILTNKINYSILSKNCINDFNNNFTSKKMANDIDNMINS